MGIEFDREVLPEMVVEEMTKMIDIEQRVILNQLAVCLEKPDILVSVLFQRLSVNAMTLGNLALVLASLKRQVIAEIALTEQKLKEVDDG